ncbi:hypothetical protein [Actinophytocola gossypii]|uniref:Twin-arginine translocation signal domain-containing protein n=1 Tax=Actinophytocola gossypii TaxID=2812003 RepID=A0ABT2J9C7_9PSEU|nr:hypothetical protein [Actinophytocola gossypii]MCT2584472.1 hypothetical protein [Actinophytocola gossypii]
MPPPEPSRRHFFRITATAATAATGLALTPGLAPATPPAPSPAGVDPYTGEPLNAGPNCDRGFNL